MNGVVGGAAKEQVDLAIASGDRERLEREGNLVRARLATTLGELDARRHELLDVKLQVRRHVLPIAITGGAFVALIATGVGFGVARIVARHRRPSFQDRFLAARRLWMHPDRVGREAKEPMWKAIGRKVLIGFAATTALRLLRPLVRLPARR